MSDVRWDNSARAYVLDISVPIPDPAGEGLVGIMKASADVREMLAAVGGVRLGDTGEAVLLRENGSIVHSRRATDPGARFFATDLLRERLQLLKKGEPGTHLFFRARTPEGDERLVGVAPSQLGRSYADLTWLVAVSQAEDELFALVRRQRADPLTNDFGNRAQLDRARARALWGEGGPARILAYNSVRRGVRLQADPPSCRPSR